MERGKVVQQTDQGSRETVRGADPYKLPGHHYSSDDKQLSIRAGREATIGFGVPTPKLAPLANVHQPSVVTGKRGGPGRGVEDLIRKSKMERARSGR